MIYYIAGLSLSRIPALAAYKRAWRVFVRYAKRIRETSFTSHFEIGLLIYGVVNHTIYKQEYRSGHNEAVLKTVCPKGTGVRIPLPAPNKRTTEPKKLGCFLFLWHWYERILTSLCDSLSRRMGFAYPTRRSKSSLFRRRVWVSSIKTNTPLPSLHQKEYN